MDGAVEIVNACIEDVVHLGFLSIGEGLHLNYE